MAEDNLRRQVDLPKSGIIDNYSGEKSLDDFLDSVERGLSGYTKKLIESDNKRYAKLNDLNEKLNKKQELAQNKLFEKQLKNLEKLSERSQTGER